MLPTYMILSSRVFPTAMENCMKSSPVVGILKQSHSLYESSNSNKVLVEGVIKSG